MPAPPMEEMLCVYARGRDCGHAARGAGRASFRELERWSYAVRVNTRTDMLLTPTELERLTILPPRSWRASAAAKGLKLNHPEAAAIIADEILEGAREGRSVADLIGFGSTILTTDDVMPGVADLMPMIQVEALSGWHQAGHRPRADPSRASRSSRERSVTPGEIIAARRRYRDQCRPPRRSRSKPSTPATVRSRSAATSIFSK